MSNKFFKVDNPRQIVTIVEDKDKFYELSDGNMIKKDTFMQKYQPVLDDVNESVKTQHQPKQLNNDTLDPDTFFNTSTIPDDVLSGIKKVDPSSVPDVNDAMRTEVRHNTSDQVTKRATSTNEAYNESLVKRVEDPVVPNVPNNTNTDVSQYKVYDDDDEAYEDFVKKNQGQQPQPKPQVSDIEKKKQEIESLFLDEKQAFGEEEAISRRNKRLLKLPTSTETPKETRSTDVVDNIQATPQPSNLNPIELMFSTFKRKHPITINVEFTDMIGDPDFVKLMVENMDGDIVGYYKKKVMENIMKDLSKIEIAVEERIKSEIFGNEKSNSSKPPSEIVNKNVGKNNNLIPGGKTKTGKQKYKYVDEKGDVKELLPSTAKTKGYEPYTED